MVEKESGQKQLENDMKITAKSASLAGTFSEEVLGYGCLVCRVLLLVCFVLKLRIVSLTDSGTRGPVLNLPRRCFALVVAAASVTDVAVAAVAAVAGAMVAAAVAIVAVAVAGAGFCCCCCCSSSSSCCYCC